MTKYKFTAGLYNNSVPNSAVNIDQFSINEDSSFGCASGRIYRNEEAFEGGKTQNKTKNKKDFDHTKKKLKTRSFIESPNEKDDYSR